MIYLSKGSFADERIDFVSVEETFTVADDIVVIVVIITVIVEFALLLVLRILALRLLRPALLLCIVNLKNKFNSIQFKPKKMALALPATADLP